MKSPFAFLTLLCLLLVAPLAVAQDLYDNGPVDGQDMGWTINFGFSVTDSFYASTAATIPGLSFWAWLIPGDTLTSVEIQIGTTPFSNSLLDQTLNVTATNCFTNNLGYNVCDETATLNGGGLNVGAGTYWLTLSNASVPSGDPAYWDQNSGPSLAQENAIGTIPSESFTIYPGGPPTTPEPTSLLLFGSGIVEVAAMLRLKMRR